MEFIDTHTHLYLEEFDSDRTETVRKAINLGISKFILPNVDSTTIKPMLDLATTFPNNCFPLIGLHPTSVKENYLEELETVKAEFLARKFYGIGEIGIDLYWDKTYYQFQIEAFKQQVTWAKELNLPIVIHSRNSMDEIFDALKDVYVSGLQGVFHCFSGTAEHAKMAVEMGFYLGIGGVLTFKNSGLDKIVADIPLRNLILETDSPYLAPVPHRGKRNESSYIPLIAAKLSEIKNISVEDVAKITTENARKLFKV